MTVVQTVLPTVGPGALESREDPNQRTTKVIIYFEYFNGLIFYLNLEDNLMLILMLSRHVLVYQCSLSGLNVKLFNLFILLFFDNFSLVKNECTILWVLLVNIKMCFVI